MSTWECVGVIHLLPTWLFVPARPPCPPACPSQQRFLVCSSCRPLPACATWARVPHTRCQCPALSCGTLARTCREFNEGGGYGGRTGGAAGGGGGRGFRNYQDRGGFSDSYQQPERQGSG